MPKIIFITGNKNKLKEAQDIIPSIVGQDIDLPEIQEVDAQRVIEAKLQEAYKHQKGEYIVEDTSLYFDCLNGLPGPLIKWFLDKLGDQGLFDLTEKYKNYQAEAKTIIGYINERAEVTYLEGNIKGKIVKPTGNNGFGWDKIFMPLKTEKTFAQMSAEEKNTISMRKIAFKKLSEHLNNKTSN